MKTETETIKRIYFDEDDQKELILKHKELENEVNAYNEKNNQNLTVWGFMMIFASRSAYDFLERFSFVPFIGKAWEIAQEEIAQDDDETDEEAKWICEPYNLDCFVQDILKFVRNEYIKQS
jgi:hypothetical protein